MDFEIKWSPEATEDIDSIANFIARDSEHYASAVVSKTIELTKTLAIFPESGRVVPELDNIDIRELFVYNYRLIYQVRQKSILILAVVHGKRQLT